MRRDDDGFGPVSRAERRAAEAFWTALAGRRARPRRFGEALAVPMPRPPLIERTYTPPPELPEPPAEDPTPFCGFTGPKGATQTLDQLRTAIKGVAEDQWTAWHTTDAVPRPRLEDDVSLFWLLVAYYVSASAKITADEVKAIHANLRPTLKSAATVLPSTLTAGTALKGIASPSDPLKKAVEEAITLAGQAHRDKDPWSGAFVSAVVRGTAIVKGLESDPTKPLSVSTKHLDYVKEALKRTPSPKVPGVPGTYQAFDPAKREPAVGDIIVQDRQSRITEKEVTQLDKINDDKIPTHGDIVVKVKADRVLTIGGNLCNSVRKREYPVQGNRLVMDRNQLFVTENSNGDIPILPSESCHEPKDLLHPQSTKRIFALLSLVEECPKPPAGGKS